MCIRSLTELRLEHLSLPILEVLLMLIPLVHLMWEEIFYYKESDAISITNYFSDFIVQFKVNFIRDKNPQKWWNYISLRGASCHDFPSNSKLKFISISFNILTVCPTIRWSIFRSLTDSSIDRNENYQLLRTIAAGSKCRLYISFGEMVAKPLLIH